MLEPHYARKRFNESFAYGAPMVDGPWDFGQDDPRDTGKSIPAAPGGEQTEASELAAIPGIVYGTSDVSRANVAASALAPPSTSN